MNTKLIKALLKALCSLDGVSPQMVKLHNRLINITNLLISEEILNEDGTLNNNHPKFNKIDKWYEDRFC